MSLELIFHDILFSICVLACLYKITTTDSDQMIYKSLAGKREKVRRGHEDAIATRLAYSFIAVLIVIWLCYLHFFFLHYISVHQDKYTL